VRRWYGGRGAGGGGRGGEEGCQTLSRAKGKGARARLRQARGGGVRRTPKVSKIRERSTAGTEPSGFFSFRFTPLAHR
jgi:hypothetical protein